VILGALVRSSTLAPTFRAIRRRRNTHQRQQDRRRVRLLEGPPKADRTSQGSSAGTGPQVPVHRAGRVVSILRVIGWRTVFRLPVG